ncbi:DUF1878 family protein [Roseovarius mucosus]|uniref:DUF1878 family protein n=1 Tax=Roseovarius mucosus TaxID=215743 RepID=UPI003BAA514B
MAEMAEIIEKLAYHVSLLGETIDYEKHPVEALILSKNWGRADIDKAHDIFEHWEKRLEKGEQMSTSEFESDFDRELGISYQGLKSIILAFYRNHQWTNVCEAYVDAFGTSPSLEYHSIMRRER